MMDPFGAMPAPPAAGPYAEPASEARPIEDVLKDCVAALEDAARADGSISERERLLLEKIRTLHQQFLADREKEHQAALGGGPATQFLARSFGSG